MKLYIRQNTIPEELMKQLGYSDYLKLFDISSSLKKEILDPLDEGEGITHFKNLAFLKERIEENGIDIFDLVNHSGKIPDPDALTTHFETGNLSQYHLYELGQYIDRQKYLTDLEAKFPIDRNFSKWGEEITSILKSITEKDYRKIRYSTKEADLRDKIKDLDNVYRVEVVNLENEVFKETGIKMIYPYPHETEKSEEADKIRKSPLVSVTEKDNIFTVSIVPNEKLKKINDEKKYLLQSLDLEIEKKLLKINSSLIGYFDKFNGYRTKREFRTFQYVLLGAAQKHGLVFPVFQNDPGVEISKGKLHQLEIMKGNKTVPLDIELKKGSNIIFGANMSGKTTVLKTIYFLISLIKLGLPVPAESIALKYPSEIDINLKTSGDVKTGESGFSKELGFLTKKRDKFAYILCDELFMTTDPVNGAKLSCFFLEDINKSDMTFLASSHYTEVTDLKNIELFKMKDADLKGTDKNLSNLMANTPYEVEKINQREDFSSFNNRPLEIALHFELPGDIRTKIETELNKGK